MTTRPRTLQLTRQVYFNRSGVLLLLAALAATILTVWALKSPTAQRQVLLAISTGLYASTLFAFLQTGLTALRYEELVHETVHEAVESALIAALAQQAEQQREFLPTRVYPASAIPDRAFNHDLDADIQQGERYVFRGVTGKFAVARLLLLNTTLESVTIMIADPSGKAVDSRATHIVSYAERRASYPAVRSRLIEDIYLTVVGARAAAARCHRLEIHVLADTQVDRVEFTDSCLYLTLYSNPADYGTKFPRTLRFARQSALYRLYAAQLARTSDDTHPSFTIRPGTTDDEIVAVIRTLGAADFDLAALRRYEAAFEEFANEFRADVT